LEHLKVFNIGHLCVGVGAGANGMRKGKARLNNLEGVFRTLGGIDVDAAAIQSFERKTGVKGTVLDLFDRGQYRAFHGHEPPADWHEATTTDIHRAFQHEHPHVLFMSFPCKGNSGLLAESKAKTAKYQALNSLALRGLMLALESYKDDPVEIILFENVPRIVQRSRHLLDQIDGMLHAYGYAVQDTEHCCGEIGGLAQRRKRYLKVARHMAKVPGFLYQPRIKPLKTVGEVLSRLPVPGGGQGGPMHRMPALQWKTWVRLALIEAGKDWRSLNGLNVENGFLTDFQIVPEIEYHSGVLGVTPWSGISSTVAGRSGPTNGPFSVADPRRAPGSSEYQQYGVQRWEGVSNAVSGKAAPGAGPYSVSDPRAPQRSDYKVMKYKVVPMSGQSGAVMGASTSGNGAFALADPRPAWANRFGYMSVGEWGGQAKTVIAGGKGVQGGWLSIADPRFGDLNAGFKERNGQYGVLRMDETAPAITGQRSPGQGRFSVADPRMTDRGGSFNRLGVQDWMGTSATVAGETWPTNGAFSIADPRPVGLNANRDSYKTGGHYGITPWDGQSGAVPASAKNNNGPWNVADPRLPEQSDRLVAVIRALDGTWHRPFTTLELAALQSMVDFDDPDFLWLAGNSDSQWREWIGNAVPEDAAQGMADVILECLLLASTGQTFILSNDPIWVRPVRIALSLAQGEAA
jgi:site-specific DNA-cytosine methylase